MALNFATVESRLLALEESTRGVHSYTHGWQGEKLVVRRLVEIDPIAVVNVDDYGALGDGSTDDTNAIQKAIDEITASATTNRILRFSPGKTYMMNQVTIDVAQIHIEGYGATVKPIANTISMFKFSYAGLNYSSIRGLHFIGSSFSGLNAVKGIHIEGAAANPCYYITVKDISAQDINYIVFADKAYFLNVDNIHCYNNTQLFVGSTTGSSTTVNFSLHVTLSNIYHHPAGSAAAFSNVDTGFIIFERVGGGLLFNIQVLWLFQTCNAIVFRNDTQGIIIKCGLSVGAAYGVRMITNTVDGLTVSPMNNMVSNHQVDQYGTTGIHITDGCIQNSVLGCLISGDNVGDTEAHGIQCESNLGIKIVDCTFRNIKNGNGIYVAANKTNMTIKNNDFCCAFTGACILVAGGVSSKIIISENYRDINDTSANYIVNGGGGGVVLRNND